MRGRRFFSASAFKYQFRDSYDFTRLLRSSSGFQSLRAIHARILTAGLHQNPFLAASLVSRYASLGSHYFTVARKVFDYLRHPDAVVYNVIIRCYAASSLPAEATAIYAQMLCNGAVRPNLYTYPFVFKACAASGCQRIGRAIHSHAIRAGAGGDLFVNNSLVALYAKCAHMETAKMVFEKMPYKDLVSWNSLISGYAQNGYHYEALELLHRMLPENLPDHVTLVSVLPASMVLASIAEGMWIHSYALKRGIGVDAAVGSGLIEMYANCGRLGVAQRVFDQITEKNVVVYNSMIRAFGIHGQASAALDIFSEMLICGIKPDSICFVSILSACSHAGLVEEGFKIFDRMEAEYEVEKGQIHYACMVDLLGRSGKLKRALEFIYRMPMEPGRDVLGALLGACKAHKNVELGIEAASRLLVIDPENAGRYAVLAKMYEELGRWEDVASARKVIKDRGVRKPLGCSMVEIATKFHTFGVEDEGHPMRCEIFGALERLKGMVDEEEKVALLS
ncbi:pentatricopeptide repeat-containing protein At3g46790, chloroplastic-like [Phalaenopsis equestris]|uniref:pentatricopeptide repeat-containing protein At3g46790, chloroplastic-like n=1 Tax=Phalaenopsis equestris TaxID=78828 RepID=UPI0009E2D91F|nr:pentatricopeptide repeat-containing protein At3g46790, chloroplastic-like [Phalaenopsis equestris]